MADRVRCPWHGVWGAVPVRRAPALEKGRDDEQGVVPVAGEHGGSERRGRGRERALRTRNHGV
jgi:hypothetical protein